MFLMRQYTSRYRFGFSLVEVLVALTVLAIGIEELLRVTGSSWVLEPCVDPVTEKIRLRWVVVEYKAPVVYYRRIYYVEMSGGGVEPFVTYITPLPFN